MDIPSEYLMLAAKFISKYGIGYRHFGLMPGMLSLYGAKKEDLVWVTMKVNPEVNLDNRKEVDGLDYWGYYNFETKNLSMIWHHFINFQVCFPYGPKLSEQGLGKCLNLIITNVQLADGPEPKRAGN